MNVLSLFDGISCARVALDRAGIEVNAYMSAEIDKNAIKISEKNYPDIIRVGSVVGLEVEGQIDLLIGGSPCQDLSIAKKDRKGLEGDRSGLFWEYVRIKKECNPQWFILENVASMPKADRDIITREMGVEPVMFNASLVSAQSRKRLFWTNIPFDLPEDRGILLKDILQPDGEVDERMVVKGKAYTLTASYSKATPSPAQVEHNIEKGQRTMVLSKHQQTNLRETDQKAHTLCSTMHKGSHANGTTLIKVGHIGNTNSQGNRVYDTDGKSVTLSAHGGGLGAKTGLYKSEDRIRKLTPIECERLQGLPDNYTEGVATTNRYKCLGNAFNVDVVAHILGRIKLMY
jgi:DNA (cytosine-5)-methyltransferase 3A